MDAAQKIRAAVGQVEQLRQAGADAPNLKSAVLAVKRFQSRRFAGTYSDLLSGGNHQAAARFFLDELYSDKDYGERDAQFSRIAGAMQKFFPHQVVAMAVALAQLHALTESLDHAMGEIWLEMRKDYAEDASLYVAVWRAVGRRLHRESQLAVVIGIGQEMAQLTRTPGLRMMLKMMRAPAAAAGLSSLQRFLEAGFDTFSVMARKKYDVEDFLATIRSREADLIVFLFDADFAIAETQLQRILGTCPVTK